MMLIPKREPEYQNLLAQETLILEATETIVALMREQGVTRLELARRLGKTKGFVSQVLAGDRNMTLRTLADLAYALGHTLRMTPAEVQLAGVEPRPTDPQTHEKPLAKDAPTIDGDPAASDSHEYALAA